MAIPFVFYLGAAGVILARLFGFQAGWALHKGSALYWIIVACAVLIFLWLTRGFGNSPESEALRKVIGAESSEERDSRRRMVLTFFLGSAVAITAAVLVSRY